MSLDDPASKHDQPAPSAGPLGRVVRPWTYSRRPTGTDPYRPPTNPGMVGRLDDDAKVRLPPKLVIVSAREDYAAVKSLRTMLVALGASVRAYPWHNYSEAEDQAALGRRLAVSLTTADLVLWLRSTQSALSPWLQGEVLYMEEHGPGKLVEFDAEALADGSLPETLATRVSRVVPKLPPDTALAERLRSLSWYQRGRRARRTGQVTATDALDQMAQFANAEEHARLQQLRSKGDEAAIRYIDDVVDGPRYSPPPVRPVVDATDAAMIDAVAQDDAIFGRFDKGRKRRMEKAIAAGGWMYDEPTAHDYSEQDVAAALRAFADAGTTRQAARQQELVDKLGPRKTLAMIEDAVTDARARHAWDRQAARTKLSQAVQSISGDAAFHLSPIISGRPSGYQAFYDRIQRYARQPGLAPSPEALLAEMPAPYRGRAESAFAQAHAAGLSDDEILRIVADDLEPEFSISYG